MKRIVVTLFLALIGLPAAAQDPAIELVFTSEPGVRPNAAFDPNFTGGVNWSWPGYDDANGDGKRDLVMVRREPGEISDDLTITGVLVRNINTGDEIWRMESEFGDEFIGQEMLGFVRVAMTDGSVRNHAVFAGAESTQLRDVKDGTSNTIIIGGSGADRRLLGGLAGDYNDDGFVELIFYRSDTDQIEVWSMGG